MLVFIDESGDSGFQFDRGSSRYFVIVALIFADEIAAEACESAIELLRKELAFPPSREFHFKSCSDKVREAFFRCIANERFGYYGFVLDKRGLCSPGIEFRDGKEFYEYAVSVVCESARGILKDAKVTIDKNGDRAFKDRLQKTLKRQMTDDAGLCPIRKLGMQASHSNSLLQLADMVCGALARSFQSEKAGSAHFRKFVCLKERWVEVWPEK
jgi:hypothetical protein